MGLIDVLIICLAAILLFMWGIPKVLSSYIRSKETVINPLDLNTKLIKDEEVVLLDIRRKKDFNNFLGHIVQAINVPLDELAEMLDKESPMFDGLKEVPVIVIDQSDSLKGLKAAKLLRANGFTNVLLLDGGLIAWIKSKLPTTKLEVRK